AVGRVEDDDRPGSLAERVGCDLLQLIRDGEGDVLGPGPRGEQIAQMLEGHGAPGQLRGVGLLYPAGSVDEREIARDLREQGPFGVLALELVDVVGGNGPG